MYQINVNSSQRAGSIIRTEMRDDKKMISINIDEHLGDGSYNEGMINLTPQEYLKAVRPVLYALGIELVDIDGVI